VCIYVCKAQVKRCKDFFITGCHFLDPYKCSEANYKLNFIMVSNYLVDMFTKVGDVPFIFLPYHKELDYFLFIELILNYCIIYLINIMSYRQHWIILVVKFSKEIVYIMDPLNNNSTGPLTIQNALNT
jgi:hypothetical protein